MESGAGGRAVQRILSVLAVIFGITVIYERNRRAADGLFCGWSSGWEMK